MFLFTGMKYVGPNGKVNNMMKPFEASKYELINISDSSIQGKCSLSGYKDLVNSSYPYKLLFKSHCRQKWGPALGENEDFETVNDVGTVVAFCCLYAVRHPLP